MKVYARHQAIQDFLKLQDLKNIEIVDDYKDCNYYISGSFKEEDYHEQLKGIIIPYTGHNGIHLDTLKTHELQLFITPTRSKYVAEKAIMLALTLLGRTITYHTLLQTGNWAERNSTNRLPWTSIQHKKIGLFGFGRIGKLIHKQLSGFNCEYVTIDRGKEVPKDITLVKDLESLIEASDVIFISVPLNEKTQGIINEELLSKMTNKFLINVGRGKVVNEEALYKALVGKQLLGYASDVWYNYPKSKEIMYPSNYDIHTLDNVVLSNHSGGYTTTTNDEVNQDILHTLHKISNNDFSDKLDVKKLI